jgi:hypothetical protein
MQPCFIPVRLRLVLLTPALTLAAPALLPGAAAAAAAVAFMRCLPSFTGKKLLGTDAVQAATAANKVDKADKAQWGGGGYGGWGGGEQQQQQQQASYVPEK